MEAMKEQTSNLSNLLLKKRWRISVYVDANWPLISPFVMAKDVNSLKIILILKIELCFNQKPSNQIFLKQINFQSWKTLSFY